jgi:amino acid permease
VWVASKGMPVFAAVVWDYWISWFIIIPVVLLVIGIGILYLVKVVSLKYPKQ